MTFGILGKMQKNQKISLKSEIISRYVRMMPATIVMILITAYIMPIAGSGPQWNIITDEAELCQKFGWRNILMIQNWFGIENSCRAPFHHITTDFTLFVFSLLLLNLLKNHLKMFVSLVTVLGVVSMIARFVVNLQNKLSVFIFVGVE